MSEGVRKRRERVPGEANRSIYRRKDAKGSTVYEVGVRNANGNQTFRTVGHKLTEARVERDNLLGARGRGAAIANNVRLQFGQAADEWLAGQVSSLAPSTQASYRNSIENHLRPRWGRRRLDRITVDDAAQLVRELRAEGSAETTIASILVAAGRVYRYAKRRLGWTGENPIAALDSSERARASATPPRRMFVGTELEETIAAAAEPWRSIFVLASVTGARISEVAGLVWADVDVAKTDEASVSFEFQVDRHGKRQKLKTPQSRRRVHLPPFLALILAELKAASTYSQPSDFVFCTRTGHPFSQRNLSRELRKAQARAVAPSGKPTFPILREVDADGDPVKVPRNAIPSWHSFRHSAASEAIAEGDPIEDVADRLGHRSTIVTETIYRHQIKSARKAAEERARLQARYGSRLAVASPEQASKDEGHASAEVVDLDEQRRAV